MPRRPRAYLKDMPYHIVQRGNNREPSFVCFDDYVFYLKLWMECKQRYDVYVHAYCLMTNHIHFIVSSSRKDGISNIMKLVGSRYAYYFNKAYSRTGTLWEGRHKSSLIDISNYLLACYRYVEMNPVRAGMVSRPELYRWSSFGANGFGDISWLDPHEEYLQLGTTVEERCANYRTLFSEINYEKDEFIREAAHYCQPVGDEDFCHFIDEKYGLKPSYRSRGRPKKRLLNI